MNFKKEAAAKAISFIKPNTIIGLGAGSTMVFMVELLGEEVAKGLQIEVLTSSFNTRSILLQKGFKVIPVADVAAIDIYFDGCDQFDKDLNALKSGGGIHTQEKLLASMATEFILVGDGSKFSEELTTEYPLVVEFLPEAFGYVPAAIKILYPGVKTALRTSERKEGAAITNNGNYLLDLWFDKWPPLSIINQQIKNITGVLETSLFYNLAHKAIIAGKGGVSIIEK